MTLYRSLLIFCISLMIFSCKQRQTQFDSLDDFPTTEESLWLDYTKERTIFKVWSPTAEMVKLNFYEKGNGGETQETHQLNPKPNGLWTKEVAGDLNGRYYTYQVQVDGKWLAETPGTYAQAVGVNGKRAMVLDLESTNPEGWEGDKGPEIKTPNEAIIYELHIRDLTIHPDAGSSYPGKYLGLVESGTKGPQNVQTAIDHIKELGITHVHLLPTYDHYSIDENNLAKPQFNWGYDPQNYNVPEGSFSTNPFDAEVRIKEFKQMVKTFHDNGIGVILDVVYNHTGRTEESNFNLENPNYYYRFRKDGSFSDAAACGNETSSDRPMTQKFILESVKYWAKEYHLDGFRFDLMGIHDIETMNKVASTVKEINPNIFVYGEGWTAGDSPLPEEKRALKKHILQMPQVSAFSDDIRDGLKGSVFEDESTGFVSGAKEKEESVKFGVVGSIQHPQIDYKKVIYSDAPWAKEPWQSISYVSCHDNHTIYDKLMVSRRDAKEHDRIEMNKLATAIVMTSQGTAFLHAGSEMLRTKYEEHNSYKSPDSINQFDWSRKIKYKEVFDYYQNLIKLRKDHPAFRMTSAEDVRKNLEFKRVDDGIVSYQIKNNANGDSWKTIYVIYNANPKVKKFVLEPGSWNIGVYNDRFSNDKGYKAPPGMLRIPATSMVILYRK